MQQLTWKRLGQELASRITKCAQEREQVRRLDAALAREDEGSLRDAASRRERELSIEFKKSYWGV